MRSLKAITIGSVLIVVMLLILQLIYLFIAVAYNNLAADYPFLHDINGLFRYVLGIPVFFVIMFAGGYFTANIVHSKNYMNILFHCLAVGLISNGSMMFSALTNANLTITGIVVILLALGASSIGGLYWLKRETAKSIEMLKIKH